MTGEVVIDLRGDGPFEWDVSSDSTGRFELRRFVAHVVEAEDVRFHHESAVFLPDHEVGATGAPVSSEGAITGLAVLRTCLKEAEANPGRKVVLVGHTDTSGPEAYNVALSVARAQNVLCLLAGDRDGWVDIALAHGRPMDYQQMLKWVARTWGLGCDPGPVDDDPGQLTHRGVRMFQAWYNQLFEADITEDGIVGRQTWGALFDVMTRELAGTLDTDEDGLARYRDALTFLSDGVKAVGFGERFPIDAPGRDDYRSRSNRRVEVLFFDPADAPEAPSKEGEPPELAVVYRRSVYAFEHVPCEPVPVLVWVDLQTVDELGYRVPDVALRLTPEAGEPFDLTTDSSGYWQGRLRAGGRITVTLADGGVLRYGAQRPEDLTPEQADGPIVIEPRVAMRAVTDLVVMGRAGDVLEQQRALTRRYGRVPPVGRTTVRAGGVREREGEEATEVSGRGAEDTRVTRRAIGNLVADNLFIAAGWTDAGVDLDALREQLHEWLADRHPTAVSRGYFVLLVIGPTILVYANDELAGRFDFGPEASLVGRFGAYAPFEVPELGGQGFLFLDMESAATYIAQHNASDLAAPPEEAEEGDDLAEGRAEVGERAGDEPTDRRGIVIEEPEKVVRVDQREAFVDLVYGLMGRGLVPVSYLVPTPGLSVHLARYGGTGLMESYPADEALRDRVHARNMRVAENTAAAYRAYIDHYIEQVRATTSESELHRLGPPESAFCWPRAAGANDDEWIDVAAAGASSLPAWEAISRKLAEIFGMRADGSIWLKFEFAAEPGETLGHLGCSSVKVNFTVDDDGRIDGPSTERRITLSSDYGSIEVDPETGNEVVKGKLGMGPYGFEVASDGSAKASAYVAQVELNVPARQVGLGVEFSAKDLVQRYWGGRSRATGEAIPDWVAMMPDLKCSAALVFQLLHEGTVLAITSNAPGFFESRPITELVRVDWDTLDADEQERLITLGWDKEKWDTKRGASVANDYPATARSTYARLSAEQKCAVVYMHLPARDPEWQLFWRMVAAGRMLGDGGPPLPAHEPEATDADADSGAEGTTA